MDGQPIAGQTSIIENDTPETANDNNQATVLLSLEDMIKNYHKRMAESKVELKKHKEMYDDGFLNNPTYIEHAEIAKQATNVLKGTKKSIASQPGQVQLALKMKALRDEIKEMKASLSDYMVEYNRMTGGTQLELFDGMMGDIVLSAKLVKRSKKVS